eukprot:CAMPEP_0197519152 /NCGR_PEP_ID=MMETSP1318-20131121/4421_1 /TAXON_ID=552666 /ORGANISM="Partenskyella glossopodia, Strain RCC365" /LENGTH=193 /DNA_ID=CAMNT_0043069973 /DNA_START=258 /DNA_END=836 /DNA_ORIENTATION=+
MSSSSLQNSKNNNQNQNEPKVKFVTNRMCPFAQRTWIALEMSGVSFDLAEISLYGSNGKPDWFWKLNPKGEVPVLSIPNGDVVIDSENTLDYIGNNFNTELLPKNSNEKKCSQKWREIINNDLKPIGKGVVLGYEKKDSIHQVLKELETTLVGPYVVGDHFTVADASAIPFFQRLESEFGVLGGGGYPKLEKW